MCGRYTLTFDEKAFWECLEKTFSTAVLMGVKPEQVHRIFTAPIRRRYNIVPTSYEPILLSENGELALQSAHWWLAPSWAGKQIRWRISAAGEKSFSWIGSPKSHFNSRWDTVTNPGNSYWHGLLENQRCLIPADGFVEWADEAMLHAGQEKIPTLFRLKRREPFFFAGVFDRTLDDEHKSFLSYNILTVEPNAMLRALPHHRMPAILTGEAARQWMDPTTKSNEATVLLRPTPASEMECHSLSRLVNSPRNESSGVLEPL